MPERPLTKAAIVQAALDLLDEDGMDGLTVRALAANLGVQAPALYWHVRGKQELLDEMATRIWREIGETMVGLPDQISWRELLETYAVTVREKLLEHRDGAKAFTGTTLTDPEVVRRQEITFQRLVRQGFTLVNAARGLVLVHDFTVGFCVEEQAVEQAAEVGDVRYDLAHRAELLGPDTAPLAVEAGPVIFADPDDRFADLISLLLDTIDRLRALHLDEHDAEVLSGDRVEHSLGGILDPLDQGVRQGQRAGVQPGSRAHGPLRLRVRIVVGAVSAQRDLLEQQLERIQLNRSRPAGAVRG
jgi:TetR/AcrR family transcriptional regulator, tetracycline repressor protein